jgi:hypothetical protein
MIRGWHTIGCYPEHFTVRRTPVSALLWGLGPAYSRPSSRHGEARSASVP